MRGSDAVSYTHLDGYSYTWFEQAWIPAGAEHQDAAKQFVAYLYSDEACKLFAESGAIQPVLGIADSLEAVSYTHLDVYKRQVIQRSEQILFHVPDGAAVLCKALQHKTDMVGVQLYKPAAYHLGGLIVPGNMQQLAVGGAGVHQQIYDLVDGVLIVRAEPEQEFHLQRLRKIFFQLGAFTHPFRFFRIERISLTHFSIILYYNKHGTGYGSQPYSIPTRT